MHIVELLMSGATGGRPTLESVTTLCHVRWASSAAQLEMVHIGLACVVPDLTERLSVEGARGRLAALATTLREGPESVGVFVVRCVGAGVPLVVLLVRRLKAAHLGRKGYLQR